MYMFFANCGTVIEYVKCQMVNNVLTITRLLSMYDGVHGTTTIQWVLRPLKLHPRNGVLSTPPVFCKQYIHFTSYLIFLYRAIAHNRPPLTMGRKMTTVFSENLRHISIKIYLSGSQAALPTVDRQSLKKDHFLPKT